MNFSFFIISFSLLIASITFAKGNKNNIDAFYKVPVTTVELESYAQFPMKLTLTQKCNSLELEYDLPRELVGQKTEISVIGQAPISNTQIHGTLSDGVCVEKSEIIECTVEYNENLVINTQETALYLASLNLSESELQARNNVALSFSGDPLGLILIPKDKLFMKRHACPKVSKK